MRFMFRSLRPRTDCFLFFLILSVSVSTYAQERSGDLAVLDFKAGTGLTTEINLGLLGQVLREEAVKATSYRVMTKENIFAILQDKGIDLSKCADVECEIQYGRILQADKLVVGEVNLVGSAYYLSLNLYDTPTAAIDRSVTKDCEGCGFRQLVSLVRDAAQELFTGRAVKAVEKKEVGKQRKPLLGLLVYPLMDVYFSDIRGMTYGGGAGYNFIKGRVINLMALGAQFSTGELSKEFGYTIEGSASFIDVYCALGVRVYSLLGIYLKPSINYQSPTGEGRGKAGMGIRGEAGFSALRPPFFLFAGGFYGGVTNGLSISVGGYF